MAIFKKKDGDPKKALMAKPNGIKQKESTNPAQSKIRLVEDKGKKPLQSKYKTFKKSLPENLAKGKERDYAMRRNWRESGKPKDFKTEMTNKEPMFELVDHGKEGKFYHAGSTSPKTGKMYKPKGHKSTYMELEGVRKSEYKDKTKLVSRGRYWKFKDKSEREMNNPKVAARVNKRTEKNYDKGIRISKEAEAKDAKKNPVVKKKLNLNTRAVKPLVKKI
jgi:hypothetical protein